MDTINSSEDRIFELESKLEKSRLKVNDLATMGTLIASILDIDTILSVVMEMSIRMVDGEVGLIQLQEEDELVSKISWGVDNTLIKNIIYKDDLDICSYCFKNQESVVFSDFNLNLPSGPTIKSVLAVPIKSRARCHGVVVIINNTSGENFNDLEKGNLEILVNFAAVAIDNSLLLKESLAKQKIEQELAIARQVQNAILPVNEMTIENIEFAMIYEPAKQVGGDFYDIVKVTDKKFLMIIGDVSNKGVPAGLVMAATAAIIKSELRNDENIALSTLMSNLNNILCDGIIKSHDMYVTLFIARFDLETGKVSYCNAGHVPPLYWTTTKNEVVELRSGGTFVGQFPDIPYKEGEQAISRGDRLFTFTDGLTEAEDVNGNFLGTKRAREIFISKKELPANQFCIDVKEWVDRFREGAKQETFDDFTIFELKVGAI
ncbi:MAG: PP2C family protein-serine/threonine phosphatase [candidate division Zixibacteria bacterium]|nr:PP2C family protein-serine/threonine phosphatase [candidate division Zixibacteria bacterium]